MKRFLYTVLYRGDNVVGVYAIMLDNKTKQYGSYPALGSNGLEEDLSDVFQGLTREAPKAIAKRKKEVRNVYAAAVEGFEQAVIDFPHDELTAAYVRAYEDDSFENVNAAATAIAHSLGMK